MISLRRAILCLTLLPMMACVTTSFTRAWLSKDNITTKSNGQLSHTRSLPPLGKGYRTYSWLGSAIGRHYAHHKVIETLQSSFAELHEMTGQTFDIAEIGARKGGEFRPHFTHQEGTSVDIMTPMKQGERPTRLSTGPLSLWGYCWHIDDQSHHLNGLKWDVKAGSKYPKLCPTIAWKSKKEVDFDTLKLMIRTIAKHAKQHGGRVTFVIVDPSFVSKLKGVGVRLSTNASLEHDDHIHVEFSF